MNLPHISSSILIQMDREKWPVKRSKRFNPKVLSKTFQDKGWQLFYDVSLLESKPLRPYYESSIPSRIWIWIFHRHFCKSNDNWPCTLWINMSQEQYPTIKPYYFKVNRKILIIWTLKSFLYRRNVSQICFCKLLQIWVHLRPPVEC